MSASFSQIVQSQAQRTMVKGVDTSCWEVTVDDILKYSNNLVSCCPAASSPTLLLTKPTLSPKQDASNAIMAPSGVTVPNMSSTRAPALARGYFSICRI
jgi:hypothetical protein